MSPYRVGPPDPVVPVHRPFGHHRLFGVHHRGDFPLSRHRLRDLEGHSRVGGDGSVGAVNRAAGGHVGEVHFRRGVVGVLHQHPRLEAGAGAPLGQEPLLLGLVSPYRVGPPYTRHRCAGEPPRLLVDSSTRQLSRIPSERGNRVDVAAKRELGGYGVKRDRTPAGQPVGIGAPPGDRGQLQGRRPGGRNRPYLEIDSYEGEAFSIRRPCRRKGDILFPVTYIVNIHLVRGVGVHDGQLHPRVALHVHCRVQAGQPGPVGRVRRVRIALNQFALLHYVGEHRLLSGREVHAPDIGQEITQLVSTYCEHYLVTGRRERH